MQVFISWSGERSRLVAELLNEWLSNVMQHLKTWYSPEMDRGSVWFNDIFSALASSSAKGSLQIASIHLLLTLNPNLSSPL